MKINNISIIKRKLNGSVGKKFTFMIRVSEYV